MLRWWGHRDRKKPRHESGSLCASKLWFVYAAWFAGVFDGLKPANGLKPNGEPWKFGAPDSDCADSLFHQLNPNGELNWLPNWFPKKDHGVLNQFHALNGDHWFQPVKDCDQGEKLLKPWKP